ncbi:hypothetical protein OS493_022745 [Desmophyllum pertusum]|uniref:Uncharacterized protein n=1 Tax=Desmophyllum pertusum TaxID=174260 RepID=A0A9X0CE69_9CNID|nr:hypothetical protein OS493_022745 [Desmophyllum pertusum]
MSGAAVHTGSTALTTPVVAATAAGTARGNMSVHTGSTALTTPVVAATAAGTARGNMSVHTGSTALTTPVVAATAAGTARGNMSGTAVHTGSTALTTPVVAATAAGTARGNMSGAAVHTGSTALTTPVVAATAAGTARRTVSGTVNTTTLDQSSFTNSVVVTGGAVIVSPSTGEALQAPAVTGARSPHTSEDSEDDEVEERGQQWRARLPRETGAETLPTTRSNTDDTNGDQETVVASETNSTNFIGSIITSGVSSPSVVTPGAVVTGD